MTARPTLAICPHCHAAPCICCGCRGERIARETRAVVEAALEEVVAALHDAHDGQWKPAA